LKNLFANMINHNFNNLTSLTSLGVEADCIEAIFNLGLVNIKIGVLNEALQAFEKLHSIIPTNTEVKLLLKATRYRTCVHK